MECGLTAYDAEFVALARALGVTLVTMDAAILRALLTWRSHWKRSLPKEGLNKRPILPFPNQILTPQARPSP